MQSRNTNKIKQKGGQLKLDKVKIKCKVKILSLVAKLKDLSQRFINGF